MAVFSFPCIIPLVRNDKNAGGVRYCGWEVKKVVKADGRTFQLMNKVLKRSRKK